MRTPEQVEKDAAPDAKLLKLIEKRKNPMGKKPDYDNPLVSKNPVFNFMPWLSLAALAAFILSLFISNDLTRTSMDLVTKTDKITYGDAILNIALEFKAGSFGFVMLLGSLIFGIVACITNFKVKARWAGAGMVSGVIASVCTFMLFIYNFTLGSFTYQQTKKMV